MERRFDPILDVALAGCVVPESLSRRLPGRFRELVAPFGDLLASDSERYYFQSHPAAGKTLLEGLAAVGRKNLESIAYAHDSDRQMFYCASNKT